MGFFDFLTSTKRPPAGTKKLSPQELRNALMSLNQPTAPYRLIDGQEEGVDLIAEWKIVDAEWREVFAKARVSKVFKIYLKFDPQKYQVRALDKEYRVSWRADIPTLSISSKHEYGRGQVRSFEFSKTYSFKERQVKTYRFSTNDMKKPIQDTVTRCGWTYKGVTFGKL